MTTVSIGDEFSGETILAETFEAQARGLMFVKWPPPVMSFPFTTTAIHKFWMKNTYCPLDIVFCRANVVVGVYRGQPLSTAQIGPDEPVDLVIELPAGTADQFKIKRGDPVRLERSGKTG